LKWTKCLTKTTKGQEIYIGREIHHGKLERVMVGEALVANTKVDFMMLEEVVIEARRGFLVLEHEAKVIQRQLQNMKKMSGNSFWPKPIIHPNGQRGNDNLMCIVEKPCGFCFWGFHCNDVAITSCKYTYQPFCLGKLLRENNNCSLCEQVLHLDWMQGWGF
jgi:hypothetical protein